MNSFRTGGGVVVVTCCVPQVGDKVMLKVQSIVALYARPESVEHALRNLQLGEICSQNISLAALEDLTLNKMEQSGSNKSQQEEARGVPWVLLEHSTLCQVSGLGPVRIAGPILFWMEADLERGVAYQGVTAFGAGLLSIGVPIPTVMTYEQALKAHQFVLIVHGHDAMMVAATEVIATTLPASLIVHGHGAPLPSKLPRQCEVCHRWFMAQRTNQTRCMGACRSTLYRDAPEFRAKIAAKSRNDRSRIMDVKDAFIRAALSEWEGKRKRQALLRVDANWRDYVIRSFAEDRKVITQNYLSRALHTGRIIAPTETPRDWERD